jgi:hypothetical protein
MIDSWFLSNVKVICFVNHDYANLTPAEVITVADSEGLQDELLIDRYSKSFLKVK